jgi:hypothetical protein
MTALAGSYVTVAEAETYFDGDPRADAFLADDMEWYLKRATKVIDALPLRGTKYYLDGTQDRAFPRQYRDGYDWNVATGAPEAPQCVLDAVCEEALAIYGILSTPDRLQRLELQREGVTSVSYSGTSETYGGGQNGSSGMGARYSGLLSKDAYDLISKYLARSFPIV